MEKEVADTEKEVADWATEEAEAVELVMVNLGEALPESPKTAKRFTQSQKLVGAHRANLHVRTMT